MPTDAALYARKRLAADMFSRARMGAAFYILGCIVVSAAGHYYNPLRWVAWFAPLMFSLFWLLRFLNRIPNELSDPLRFKRWLRGHWVLIHLGCLLWTAVFIYVGALEQALSPPVVVAALCTVAYGTAISQTFALDLRQALLSITVLIAPCLLYFAFWVPAMQPVILMLGIYSIYLYINLRRAAREYQTQIQTELDLLQSRAEVLRLLNIDGLTGLASRREFDRAFEQLWLDHRTRNQTLAMLVIDLDYFKQINDTHGHLSGDRCLQHFAGLLQDVFLASNGVLARFGGEEFVVLLPGQTTEAAQLLAHRLRQQLAQHPCLENGGQIGMTASIGVGQADWQHDTNPADTFRRIDKACYQAKHNGRDQVCLAPLQP